MNKGYIIAFMIVLLGLPIAYGGYPIKPIIGNNSFSFTEMKPYRTSYYVNVSATFPMYQGQYNISNNCEVSENYTYYCKGNNFKITFANTTINHYRVLVQQKGWRDNYLFLLYPGGIYNQNLGYKKGGYKRQHLFGSLDCPKI